MISREALVAELQECINQKDFTSIRRVIADIIRYRVNVTITPTDKVRCSSHFYLYQGMNNEFSKNDLYASFMCSRGHRSCIECLRSYLYPLIQKKGFMQRFECIACINQHIPHSQLFDQNLQLEYIRHILGNDAYEQLERALTINEEETKTDLYDQCAKCSLRQFPCQTACVNGHKLCLQCVADYITDVHKSEEKFKCLIQGCNRKLFHDTIKKLLEPNEDLISLVWNKLTIPNMRLSVCPNPQCNRRLELDVREFKETCKYCGIIICTRCTKAAHDGTSCYNQIEVLNTDALFVDLEPPKHGYPRTINEEEYINAKYSFDQFIKQDDILVKSVKLIVNRKLEEIFEQRRKQLIEEGKKEGEDWSKEKYVFHASKYENYEKICRGGFKIGGIDPGFNAVNGVAHGFGVYTATTPDFSLNYAKEGNWMMICKALPGKNGNKVNSPEELMRATHHSHLCRSPGTRYDDIQVFFTSAQVLPKYLVEFASRRE
ncbi:unnamed protein product [Blepharisma stoltei]|uniref:PARP catalytic domain-containing protein n=1 Tax=Blepharisma stoltei TaxID=1481888 RepID=A0AAU9JFZ4_9CILI|nr:unnamed protein product [Blepharisma stoltei]